MGVIDLDARVKKLEQGSSGSAEIDQIEADLTALENTVRDLIEDVTDKLTWNPGLTFAAGSPTVSITRIGNLCYMVAGGTISAGSESAGTLTTLATLDSSIWPDDYAFTYGMGHSNSAYVCCVNTDGTVTSKCGDFFRFEAFWKIATPTP